MLHWSFWIIWTGFCLQWTNIHNFKFERLSLKKNYLYMPCVSISGLATWTQKIERKLYLVKWYFVSRGMVFLQVWCCNTKERLQFTLKSIADDKPGWHDDYLNPTRMSTFTNWLGLGYLSMMIITVLQLAWTTWNVMNPWANCTNNMVLAFQSWNS
jgi:hypothetical protein